MIAALLLLAAGVILSAFFSGAETGFYRVTRVRLVIGALGGDYIDRGLLWLTNYPTIFVATALVGNNLANYLVSLAIVMGASQLFPGGQQTAEVLAPILLAPLLFVLGESMPKTVFYTAPNRMLRRCGPPLLAVTVLFMPVTILLWCISRALELIVGQSPQRLQMVLARRELEQVFEEGREAGILNPAQQALAQGLFALANQPVQQFATPAAKTVFATTTMSKQEILRIARRHRLYAVPIEGAVKRRQVVGYFRIVDLYLDESGELPAPRPIVRLRASDPVLQAIAQLNRAQQSLGHVVDADGRSVGFVTSRGLTQSFFRSR